MFQRRPHRELLTQRKLKLLHVNERTQVNEKVKCWQQWLNNCRNANKTECYMKQNATMQII